MAEKSLFWYTNGFTGDTGDGAAPYTQEEFRLFNHAWAANNQANVGVFPGVLNELAVTGSSSPLSVDTGRAVVYGFPYWADSSVSVAVSTPSIGTTGGRVALRADWTAQTVRAVALLNTDGTAAIPSLTQSAGSTWNIPLATFTITTGGTITLTDAREWVAPAVDDETIEVNSSGQLTTIGAAQVTDRQGGDATDWDFTGTTDYSVTGKVAIQVGDITISSGGAVTITFPQAFTAQPILIVSQRSVSGADVFCSGSVVSATQGQILAWQTGGTAYNGGRYHWMAIGPVA